MGATHHTSYIIHYDNFDLTRARMIIMIVIALTSHSGLATPVLVRFDWFALTGLCRMSIIYSHRYYRAGCSSYKSQLDKDNSLYGVLIVTTTTTTTTTTIAGFEPRCPLEVTS